MMRDNETANAGRGKLDPGIIGAGQVIGHHENSWWYAVHWAPRYLADCSSGVITRYADSTVPWPYLASSRLIMKCPRAMSWK